MSKTSLTRMGPKGRCIPNRKQGPVPRTQTPESFRRGQLMGRGAYQYDPSAFGVAPNELFQRGRRMMHGLNYETNQEALDRLRGPLPQRTAYRPQQFHICDSPEQMIDDLQEPDLDINLPSNGQDCAESEMMMPDVSDLNMLGEESIPSLCGSGAGNLSQEVIDELAGLAEAAATAAASSPEGAAGGVNRCFLDNVYNNLVNQFTDLKARINAQPPVNADGSHGSVGTTTTQITTECPGGESVQESVITSTAIDEDGKQSISTKRIVTRTDASGNVSTSITENKNSCPGADIDLIAFSPGDNGFGSSVQSPGSRLTNIRNEIQNKLKMPLPHFPSEELDSINSSFGNISASTRNSDYGLDQISEPTLDDMSDPTGNYLYEESFPAFSDVSPIRPTTPRTPQNLPSCCLNDQSIPTGGSGVNLGYGEFLDDMSMPSGGSICASPLSRPSPIFPIDVSGQPIRDESMPSDGWLVSPHNASYENCFDASLPAGGGSPKRSLSWPWGAMGSPQKFSESGDLMQFSREEPCSPPGRVHSNAFPSVCLDEINQPYYGDMNDTAGECLDEQNFPEFFLGDGGSGVNMGYEECLDDMVIPSGGSVCASPERTPQPYQQTPKQRRCMRRRLLDFDGPADEPLSSQQLDPCNRMASPMRRNQVSFTNECMQNICEPSFSIENLDDMNQPYLDDVSGPTGECLDQQSFPEFQDISMSPNRPMMPQNVPSFSLGDESFPSGGSAVNLGYEERIDNMSMPSGGSVYASPLRRPSPIFPIDVSGQRLLDESRPSGYLSVGSPGLQQSYVPSGGQAITSMMITPQMAPHDGIRSVHDNQISQRTIYSETVQDEEQFVGVSNQPSGEHIGMSNDKPVETVVSRQSSSSLTHNALPEGVTTTPNRHTVVHRISKHTVSLLPDDLENISPFADQANISIHNTPSSQSISSVARRARDLSLPDDNLENVIPPNLLMRSRSNSRRGSIQDLENITAPSFDSSGATSIEGSFMGSSRAQSPQRDSSVLRAFDTMANYESFDEAQIPDSPCAPSRVSGADNRKKPPIGVRTGPQRPVPVAQRRADRQSSQIRRPCPPQASGQSQVGRPIPPRAAVQPQMSRLCVPRNTRPSRVNKPCPPANARVAQLRRPQSAGPSQMGRPCPPGNARQSQVGRPCPPQGVAQSQIARQGPLQRAPQAQFARPCPPQRAAQPQIARPCPPANARAAQLRRPQSTGPSQMARPCPPQGPAQSQIGRPCLQGNASQSQLRRPQIAAQSQIGRPCLQANASQSQLRRPQIAAQSQIGRPCPPQGPAQSQIGRPCPSANVRESQLRRPQIAGPSQMARPQGASQSQISRPCPPVNATQSQIAKPCLPPNATQSQLRRPQIAGPSQIARPCPPQGASQSQIARPPQNR